jgi:DNA repair exonuclease SbcCD ATPase subunit
MSNEPTNTKEQFVDPNTDDLDSFENLLTGKAQVKEVEEASEEIEEESSTEKEETQDVESEEKPVKKKTSRFQERIDQLTAAAKEAERKLAEYEAKQLETAKPEPAKPQQKVEDNAPKFDDLNADGTDKYPLGNFDPAFTRDLTLHILEEKERAANERAAIEAAQRQEQEARTQLQQEWEQKLEPASEKYEDFLDKVVELEDTFSGLDPAYSDYLTETVKSLEHGPDVLYYFANNLEEAKKFIRMGPLQATLALGEYNAMFKSGAVKKETKVSKAPPPPQVNKGSKTRTSVAADTDDLDAFTQLLFSKD